MRSRSLLPWSVLLLAVVLSAGRPSVSSAAAPAPPAAKPTTLVLDVTIKTKPSELELLACKQVRLHETVVLLDVTPDDLAKQARTHGFWSIDDWRDVASSAAGNPEGTDDDEGFSEHWGDRLLIWLEWSANGKTIRVRPEDLIYDMLEGRHIRRTGWVYQGSRGDIEVEMPLTFKGLNAARAFGTSVVYPRAYLDDPHMAYYRTGTRYVTLPERLPVGGDPSRVGVNGKMILEPVTETRLLELDIAAATAEPEKQFLRTLLPAAGRIDEAKQRLKAELYPTRRQLVKEGLELAKKADADEKVLASLAHRAAAALAELQSLQKQIRRDYLEIELAFGQRDLERFEALKGRFADTVKRFRMAGAQGGKVGSARTEIESTVQLLEAIRYLNPRNVKGDEERFADRLGGHEDWKLAALAELYVLELLGNDGPDLEELPRQPKLLEKVLDLPADWKRKSLAEYGLLREAAEQQRAALAARAELEKLRAEAASKGQPVAEPARLRLTLTTAVADNRAEIAMARIKSARMGWHLGREEEKNRQIAAANGGMLSEFAREITDRLKMQTEEAARRITMCQTLIAAAEAHQAWLSAAEAEKPTLWKSVQERQQTAGRARMRHRVVALDEELDILKFRLGKIIDDAKLEAELKAKIETAEVERKSLIQKLTALGEKP